jgi:pyruvate ferredoxin oxidoreductase gamma subunit
MFCALVGEVSMASEVLEIRWHGRGGQGAKTAAQLVAQIALEEGRFSQGFPEYGPERMGAPIRGFTRVSDKPIRLHCAIEQPDVVVVLDDTMVGMPVVTEAVDRKTIFVVNTPQSPAEMREKLTGASGSPVGAVYCVDATKISIDELGRPMPNTPMIGALVKATACISISVLKKDIQKKFLAKFGERVVRGNIRAIERAYEEVLSS